MADSKLEFRVAVGAQTCRGPDLFGVIVCATPEEFEEGDHYTAAENFVKARCDAEGPFWCVDHQDPAKEVLNLIEWKSMSKIDCSKWMEGGA